MVINLNQLKPDRIASIKEFLHYLFFGFKFFENKSGLGQSAETRAPKFSSSVFIRLAGHFWHSHFGHFGNFGCFRHYRFGARIQLEQKLNVVGNFLKTILKTHSCKK